MSFTRSCNSNCGDEPPTSCAQEASFEAIRLSLTQGGLSCAPSVPAPCTLAWRQDATRNIILFTREDSDLPTAGLNRMTGQSHLTSFGAGGYFDGKWYGGYYQDGSRVFADVDYYEPSFEPSQYALPM
jgi:hypothetical protein